MQSSFQKEELKRKVTKKNVSKLNIHLLVIYMNHTLVMQMPISAMQQKKS